MKRILTILCLFFSLPIINLYGQNSSIDSLINLARSFDSSESLNINSLISWQKALNESKEDSNGYRIDEICLGLGNFFFDYGLYENAIENYATSLLFPDQFKPGNQSAIFRKLGQSHSMIGDPDKAFFYYDQILDEFEYPAKLDVLRELIDIYAANGNYAKSLEYNLIIEDLLLQRRAANEDLAKVYNNIGFCYHHLEQYPESIKYFEGAMKADPHLDKNESSAILRNLGISYYNLKDYKKSLDLLQTAFDQVEDYDQQAELAHLIAIVYAAEKDYFHTISSYSQAEDLAKKANKPELLADVYQGMATAYNETHEYDLAFEYFKRYSNLSDSLKFVEQLNQKRILDNQKYIDRIEKENQILKAEQDIKDLNISRLETEAKNTNLRNEALEAKNILRQNELAIALQRNKIAQATEEYNKLEIERQKDLLSIQRQELAIAKANEEFANSEKEKKENELAYTLERKKNEDELKKEQDENEFKAREIEKSKTRQRNSLIIASLLALLALFILWAYRNKRRDNTRLTLAYDTLAVAQEKLKKAETKIKGLLSQQVSGAVAEALITNPEMAFNQEKFVCVMFLDIRDFTSFCEGKEPDEIIAYQNSIFGFMINIVEEYHGVVNQLMGDGFMATFGAPIAVGNECQNAYNAASRIIEELTKRNKENDIIPTKIGIGLHAGNVVTGNVGNEHRKQFSITGNTVILAARLEQLNKQFGSTLVYSKEVYNGLPEKEKPQTTFNPIMVKGRSKPIDVAFK